MDDYHKMLRQYETSIAELPAVKDAILLLKELRAMGIARGSDIRPFRSRQTLSELQSRQNRHLTPTPSSKI